MLVVEFVLMSFLLLVINIIFFFKFSGRAWREKLEQAEIRKREETKELQVISFFGVTFILLVYSLSIILHPPCLCSNTNVVKEEAENKGDEPPLYE